MYYMQQKYYRADYVHLKSPVFAGMGKVCSKSCKIIQKRANQLFEKRKKNENIKKHQHITPEIPNQP